MSPEDSAEVGFRPAQASDSRRIAELYRSAAGGVADYVWRGLDESGARPVIEIGEERFARRGEDFSYQNCVLAQRSNGEIVGLLHSYPVHKTEEVPKDFDPILRPYAELELEDSLYIAGVAVAKDMRGRGIGSRLIGIARARAVDAGLSKLSLLAFSGNQGAVKLYERYGFKTLDKRRVVEHAAIQYSGDVLLMAARTV